MNPELKKRLQAFAWQQGWLLVAALSLFAAEPHVVSQLREVLPGYAWLLPILAGALNQLSKYASNKAKAITDGNGGTPL